MSRFAPVHLPADRQLDGRASQTFLRHFNACPRSGYLYALTKGEAKTVEMERGSAMHAILERATRAAIEHGEPIVPGELVKAIAEEVLAEYAVPVEEHDYVREACWRWSSETLIDPRAVIACETLIALDVAGYEVRAKIDYAELLEDGAAVLVRDYKSGRGAPSYEDISRKRRDGTFAAKNVQLIIYALALAFGQPVRRDGDVEVREPFPLAARAQRFDLEFVFPGIEDREGRMLRRPVSLTRLELEEYRGSLEALLARVARAERSGDWPAVVSDAACGECPASGLCPIPVELRDHRGSINTLAEASEAAEVVDRKRAINDAIVREIKAFSKAHGGVSIRYGADKVYEFAPRERTEIPDKNGMFDAVDRAVQYGEPFERSRFVKTSNGTSFASRTLTADELDEERADV